MTLHFAFTIVLAAATCGVQPATFGPTGWKGGTPDSKIHKVWPQSVCWEHGKSTGLTLSFRPEQDWTQSAALAFWLHSEKATGSKFMLILPSENSKSNGPDYYSYGIKLDWTGWKRFVLPFAELGSAREPLGWNHIQAIRFTASGYNNTPDPTAVVRIDGVELLSAAAMQMTDADLFELLDLDAAPLAAVKAAVKKGDLKAAKAALAVNFRSRELPRWSIDWRQPAFLTAKKKPRAGAFSAAEKAMKHQFDYTQGPLKKGTLDFGPKIDWTANPTEGEARTHLWNESLNRHFHFNKLSDAYWQSGDERFAQEIADEILDWIASNPPVLLSSGNRGPDGCEAWQTLTTGIRLANTWPTAIYRCLGSKAFNDDVIAAIYKSVCQQCRHLVDWPSRGNWLTAESNGLLTAGVLFPEFREAAEWRRIALERLYLQLDDEVYPDGMQFELAAGYNNWVVREFTDILDLVELNGRRGEIPADFLAKMEKMYNYLLLASMPNGAIPGLNDSGNADVRQMLETGFRLFPKRTDFQFVATGGKSGKPPAQTSHAFPFVGHYVTRSGWDKDATYMLFDVGPYGAGHQHEDKLHFVLWSHGRQLILDPGNFSYDKSRWRRYVLSTAGHNTVMVDGQDQHRRGNRDLYWWPRPWTGSAPANNDARWLSTSDYDLATGVYAEGYGPKNEIAVTHQRRIVWLKSENVFLITDTLTPRDSAEHRYEALFHLDSDNARVDGATQAVCSDNPTGANVTIVPSAGLAVSIVKGKEDEPVQGWSSGPWRAIPTAIYTRSASGTVQWHFAVEPLAKGVSPQVIRVESDASSVRLVRADGRTVTVLATADGVTLERSAK
jgi:hypothetical protein